MTIGPKAISQRLGLLVAGPPSLHLETQALLKHRQSILSPGGSLLIHTKESSELLSKEKQQFNENIPLATSLYGKRMKAQIQEGLSFLIHFSHLDNKANFKEMKELPLYKEL